MGHLDNVPMEDCDEESVSSIEYFDQVWHRTSDGTWVRHWREADAPVRWDPSESGQEPEDLVDPIIAIQAVWRGYTVRSKMAVAGTLLAIKKSSG